MAIFFQGRTVQDSRSHPGYCADCFGERPATHVTAPHVFAGMYHRSGLERKPLWSKMETGSSTIPNSISYLDAQHWASLCLAR
eukprot:1715243-Rhodomonas_salina.3